VIAKKSKRLLSLSKKQSKDINVLARNAVSLASEDRLPIARLVLTQLLYDGHLQGAAKEWFQQFPKPSSIEKFLENYIHRRFRPNQQVFTELLEFGINSESEENCIKNLFFSFGDLPRKSSILLDFLGRKRVLRAIDAEKVFVVVKEFSEGINLDNDLDLEGFSKLPKSWRIFILANKGIINSYLSPSLQKKISKDPYSIRESPSSVKAAETFIQLETELKNREINPQTISRIIYTEGMLERLDKSFDWSVLRNTTNPTCLNSQESSHSIELEILKHKFPIPSAANLFLLHLVWLSAQNQCSQPDKDPSALSMCLKSAGSEAISFCVRNAQGKFQRDVIAVLKRDLPGIYKNRDVANWVLTGNITGETDIGVLMDALLLVSEGCKNSFYSAAISNALLAIALLEHSEEFLSFYLSQLKRGKFPEYVVSYEAFCVYGKLEEAGGAVIETILAKLNKLTPPGKAQEIFQKTISLAPGAAATVFSNRGILPRQFAEILSSSEFERLSKSAQIGIFELKTPNGKSAFREALRKGEIDPSLMSRIERFSCLRKYLVRYRPSSLVTRKASIPEYLASLVYTPGNSEKVAEAYTKADLLRALPQALKLLEGRSRVSAALDLQLVRKLAPPFQAHDVGRRFDDLYTTYELPKKSGGKRIISAPAPHLKSVQRALLALLYEENFSDATMGFRPGKSVLDNAACHTGKNIVVNADIREFFSSTTYKQVYSLSRRLAGRKLSPMAARLFAEICCHNGLILKPMDDTLTKISEKISVSYSRYADDVTFSGDSAAVWMLKPLESQLARLGYELDAKKTNIFRKGRRQTVTGAVVNEKVTLARPLRKKLRAAVHRRVNGAVPTMHGRPLSDQALKGYLAYLSMLSPEHAKPLLAKLEGLKEWQP
jgi:retron-type reverse transcriptase